MRIAPVLIALTIGLGGAACAPDPADDTNSSLATTSGPDAVVLFEEEFSTLDSEWSWTREDPSGWSVAGGALLVRSDPGGLAEDGNDNRNLLTRPAPTNTDFVAEVTVGFQPEAMYEQAGLILYVGDDDFVKLQVERTELGREVTFTSETRGIFSGVASRPAPNGPVQLRLGRYVNRMRAHLWEPAEGTWSFIGETPALGPAQLQVGLVGGFGSAQSERWATYRGFRLLAGEG